jgi:GTP-binding protein
MSPSEAYHTIRSELQLHSPVLADKPELVVANKIDLTGSAEAMEELKEQLRCDVVAISAATGRGLDVMQERLWSLVASRREPDPEPERTLPTPPHLRDEP